MSADGRAVLGRSRYVESGWARHAFRVFPHGSREVIVRKKFLLACASPGWYAYARMVGPSSAAANRSCSGHFGGPFFVLPRCERFQEGRAVRRA